MASNLFNKNWDRAISPIVGAPRFDQVFQGNFASSPIRNQSPLRSTQSPLTPTQSPYEVSDLRVRYVTVDYKLAESLSLEIDPQGKKAMREIWDEYVKDLEARLLAVICEKLRVNGRIAPDEPLLKEPDPNGRGFTLYQFPGA